MCQGLIRLREVSLLPILMNNDKFKWKGDGGLIKPRQRKVENFIHFFHPSICLLSNLLLSTSYCSGTISVGNGWSGRHM